MLPPTSPAYTLWLLRRGDLPEVLLIAEYEDGREERPVLARGADDIRRYFAAAGMPKHITANARTALRLVREAEPRLFHVSADVLKPHDLVDVLLAHLLAAYRP